MYFFKVTYVVRHSLNKEQTLKCRLINKELISSNIFQALIKVLLP